MAMINGMYVLVESEDPKFEVDVTDQPVEDGINVSDHVQRKPYTMDISGFIVGDDAAQIREKIKAIAANGELVEFQGRNLFSGLIVSFVTSHTNRVANGFAFSLSMKEIRTAKSSYVETLPMPIKAQVAPVVSAGRKQTKKKKGTAEKKVEKVKFKAGTPWAE
ncbi:phage baseplate protein [Brevibacillus sp. NPDC003359]|uniref:phage baseplate protein n=1 Tax=unclassified Brevibacillus TaxID=2684853 RepID=UPI003695C476